MALPDLVMIITRLVFGAAATILALILWSVTRDTAWMFVVMATILKYGDVLYGAFKLFGIVGDEYRIAGIPLMPLLLENLPTICYIVAFSVMIARTRGR
ncbi:MAG TPA: hypothetical protein PLG43_01145 [Spirochaetia bacterium]|nr:hypothetical protein [Spirochaetia bacterium]